MRIYDFFELLHGLKRIDYNIQRDERKRGMVGWYGFVLKSVILANGIPYEIEIDTTCMRSSEDRDKVLNAFVELMNTPPSEWEEPKRYIVPLPGLTTTDGEQQYLTQKGKHWFACRRNKNLRQTWKEEHIKYVPEEYRHLKVEVSEWEQIEEANKKAIEEKLSKVE